MRALIELVEGLESAGVHFASLTDAIDTTSPAGRFFFHVMASLAQMEREFTVERPRAGLAAARKLGRIGRRPRKMTAAQVKAAKTLLGQGTPVRDVAESLGVSVPTPYR